LDHRQLGMGQKYRGKLNFNYILDVNIFYSPEGKDISFVYLWINIKNRLKSIELRRKSKKRAKEIYM